MVYLSRRFATLVIKVLDKLLTLYGVQLNGQQLRGKYSMLLAEAWEEANVALYLNKGSTQAEEMTASINAP